MIDCFILYLLMNLYTPGSLPKYLNSKLELHNNDNRS